MNSKDIYKMTNEELLVEKKNMNKSKIFNAFAIGFLGAILVFGFSSWFMNPKMNIGILISMFIPIFIIYKLIKKPNNFKELEEELTKRGLN